MISQFFLSVLSFRNVSSKTYLQEEVGTKGKQSFEQQKIKGGKVVIEVRGLCVSVEKWPRCFHSFNLSIQCATSVLGSESPAGNETDKISNPKDNFRY